MNKPQCNCPKCGRAGVFIRDRNFADGSGKVFMCESPTCEMYRLYFYPKKGKQKRMKHILKRFTVHMSAKMAKEVAKEFNAVVGPTKGARIAYMVALTPRYDCNLCHVAIISDELGGKIKKFIDRYKAKDGKQ